MITGHDSVLVLAGDPSAVVRRFLNGWVVRWPGMRVAIGEDDSALFESWVESTRTLATDREELLVSRDVEMESFWDEHGYALDATGQGPFAIYYSPYEPRSTEVVALESPYDRGEGFRYEPSTVVLVGHGLSLLTLVTPNDAEEFRATLLEALIDQVSSGPTTSARV